MAMGRGKWGAGDGEGGWGGGGAKYFVPMK